MKATITIRGVTIVLVTTLLNTAAQAETARLTATKTTKAIVDWHYNCTEIAGQADPLATVMTMDCVFNAIKYCRTLPDDAAKDICNTALTMAFTNNAAKDMEKLKAYSPKNPMRKKGWSKKLDMLALKTQTPCPAPGSKTGCDTVFAGMNWSLIHTYRREIEADDK